MSIHSNFNVECLDVSLIGLSNGIGDSKKNAHTGSEIILQSTSEIRNSLDFGRSIIVWFEIDRILEENLRLKSELMVQTEQFTFGSIHKSLNRTARMSENRMLEI